VPVHAPWDATRYVVSIRPVDALDADVLRAFYAGLSPASRRRRFFGSGAVPTLHQCRRFTELGHAGFVAVLVGPGPCDGDVIGHLGLEPLGDGREEIEVVVADQYQHRHIARDLVLAGLQSARRRGVRELRGIFLLRNEPLLRLLRHLPGARLRVTGEDIAECSIALRPAPSAA
jgi:acetyltransferase